MESIKNSNTELLSKEQFMLQSINRSKMRRIFLITTALIFVCLTACVSLRDSAEVDARSATLSLPTVTPPPGKSIRDINIDPNMVEWSLSMADSHPGGLGVGVYPAYQNSYPDWKSTYYGAVDSDFEANLFLLNGDDQTRQFAIICLLDHRQTPCAPDAAWEYLRTLEPEEFQFVPITLTNLMAGFHDLDFLVVRDPYVDILADNLTSRETTAAIYRYSNLLVDNNVRPPLIEPLSLITKQRAEFDGLLYISQTPDLFDETGWSIPFWLEIEGEPGEMFDFYLHFSGPSDKEGEVIAIMGFIDYQQIPLHHEGAAHIPLYVERRASQWEFLPVQMQLPLQPGVYEFFVVARSGVFQGVDLNRRRGDHVVATEYSTRIRMVVR
jgi:hypothetical protein